MPGLRSRILSRRPAGAPAPADEQVAAAEQPTEVLSAVGEPAAAEAPPAEQPTDVQPSVEEPNVPIGTADGAHTDALPEAPATDVPAGADPDAPRSPAFRHRGRLRRRLRYLRRVREIAFRDLGGLVFDLDRFGKDRPDLIKLKLEGLQAIDAELRALEVALDDEQPVEELREAGIAACARCGAIHGSDAAFCPACGRAIGEPEPEPMPEPAADEPPADAPPAEQPAA